MSRLHYKDWYLTIIFALILATYSAILFNIPYIRFILGIIFLMILPGIVILPLLNITKISFFEKCFLIVGISVSFIYFYGLCINYIAHSLGYEEPLATISIFVNFSYIYILMAYIGRNNHYYNFKILKNFNLSPIEKCLLIIPCILPALLVVSMHHLNTYGSNFIFLISLLLIPCHLLLMTHYKDGVNQNLFPFTLLSISLSVLSIWMLRHQFIWGSDVQREFGLHFLTTLENLHWIYLGGNLGTALSISLLPAIVYSICQINYIEFLFKFTYFFIVSFSPLIIYFSLKQYVGNFFAFCASLYFTFQFTIMHAVGTPRTAIAIFFCCLVIYMIFNNDIQGLAKNSLILLFLASIVVSHYSTAYIFFILLFFGAFASYWRCQADTKIRYIKYNYIAFYLVFLISWTFILLWSSSLISGVNIFLESLFDFFEDTIVDKEVSEAQALFYPIFENRYLTAIHWVTVWFGFIMIGIGLLYSLVYLSIEKFNFLNLKKRAIFSIDYIINKEYLFMGLISSGLLVAFLLFQSIASSYGSQRLFAITSIINSLFLVIGLTALINLIFILINLKRVKINKNKIINFCFIIFIILTFLFTHGVPYQIAGIHQAHLSQDSIDYMNQNIYESEKSAAVWLKEHYATNTNIRRPGTRPKELWSAGSFPLHVIRSQRYDNNYIYFGKMEGLREYEGSYLSTYDDFNHIKIFSSKDVNIYYV